MTATPRDGQKVSVIGELPNEMARLFGDPRDILRIVSDAGLDPRGLVIHGLPPAIAWTWILMLAEHRPGIRAVIQTAMMEAPDNEALARAMQGTPSSRMCDSPPNSQISVNVNPTELSISAGTSVFRFIPPGTAWIGSDDGYEHERPRHQVRQSGFFLQDGPVTRSEFETFCESTGFRTSAELGAGALYVENGLWRPVAGASWKQPSGGISHDPGGDDHPVVQVSWYDASIYCRWFAEQTGLSVGLPTEAQWQYAAGGPTGPRWPFGDRYEPGMANIGSGGTTPIRHFKPNDFLLSDMVGNVYQWCADWYTPRWTGAGHALSGTPSLNPPGPGSGNSKVLHGGSWFDNPFHCRIANRFYADPMLAAANWGFRPCVRLTDDLVGRLIAEPEWAMRAEDMLREVKP